MIPGVKVRLGEEEFIIPPLTLGQLRNGIMDKMKRHDECVAKGEGVDAFLLRCEIVGEAVRRNYPEMTDEKLNEILDMRNSTPAWFAAIGGTSEETESAGPLATTSGQSTGS